MRGCPIGWLPCFSPIIHPWFDLWVPLLVKTSFFPMVGVRDEPKFKGLEAEAPTQSARF